jgi:hypothetical protein
MGNRFLIVCLKVNKRGEIGGERGFGNKNEGLKGNFKGF